MVSIIIPVYNAEKYLKKCLTSIFDQKYSNYEILAVNDGSIDESYKILCDYQAKKPQIFKVYTQANKGQSCARNLAMNFAKGKYVTFLDSDDYIKEDYLEVLVNAAENYQSDMVCSGEFRVDENGKVISKIRYKLDKKGNCALRRLNFSGKLYKRTFLEKNGISFAEGKVYEDNPFNIMTFALAKRLVILDYIGYYQVVHMGSTTTKKIQTNKLPFDEIEKAIIYVKNKKTEVDNYELFEYTVFSFFTYFLFKASKQHYYFDIDGRKSDKKVVFEICDYVTMIIHNFFPNYKKNSYVKSMKGNGISNVQRVSVFFFIKLIESSRLKDFVKIYYRY